MSAWRGLKWYYEVCGIRGIGAVGSFRLCGRPRELSIAPCGSQPRVYLRIDTSDFCAYRDVLLFATKSYDPCIPNFIPTTIVDVGAHIGMASIFFALRYPTARVIAIEPEESNFAALVRNTSSCKRILPIRAAVWHQNEEVSLGASNAHPKGAFQIVDNGAQRVRAITMDTLMSQTGINSIDLLKFDIEGAEVEVFQSCPWIEKVRVISIELHDRLRPGCTPAVHNAAKDFRCRQQGEITFFERQTAIVKGSYLRDPFTDKPAPSTSTAA